jgi:membrane-bound ClpP family serine protease
MAGSERLTLASIAFAALPTNWLGVVVIIAAVGLMAVELKATTHGARRMVAGGSGEDQYQVSGWFRPSGR